MSSRERGQKTLSAEDTIDAEVVNTLVLEADGNEGSAGQFLIKDTDNALVWSALVVPDKSITGGEIADATITGGKLATDINIQTSGNIQATGTGVISTINGNINCAGTGDISVNSGDISTASGDIIISGGKLKTNTIDKVSGSTITIAESLLGATDKGITLQGTGGILTINGGFTAAGSGDITAASGDITAGSGKLKGNTLAVATGTNLTIENDILCATDKNIVLQGTGQILTNNGNMIITGTGKVSIDSGDIETLTGKLKGNTIAKASGSYITIEDTISFAATKGIITDDGDILSSSGDITTGSGKLKANTIAKAGGSTITIEDPIDCGSNNITTTGQVSAGTLSVSTFAPTSLVITGSGNIQTTSGKVLANTIGKGSSAVSVIVVEDDLLFATGKGLLTGTGSVETTSGAIATDSGDISTAGGHVATTLLKGIGAGSGSDITCLTNIQMGAKNVVASTGSFTTTSGHITNSNGNITATTGSVITNTIAKSSGSAISISDPINVNGDVVGVNLSGTGLISGEGLTIYRNPLGGFHTIVIMDNLPTSAPTTAGQVWNNGGVLNIV